MTERRQRERDQREQFSKVGRACKEVGQATKDGQRGRLAQERGRQRPFPLWRLLKRPGHLPSVRAPNNAFRSVWFPTVPTFFHDGRLRCGNSIALSAA